MKSGYRSIKPFIVATTSKLFGLRFFYFAFQVELTGEYEHTPMVTADNTLTLLKKETGIG